MPRGKATSIGPRGSGCRTYADRTGFFWEKNVAPYSERWPDVFPRKLIRERCLDALGAPATNEKQALAYCYRRQDEVSRQIDELKEGPRQLAPDDVDALARGLAARTAGILRKEVPLHRLDTAELNELRALLPYWERWQQEAPVDLLLESPDADWGQLLDFANNQQINHVSRAFEEALQARGLKLAPETLLATKAAYASALEVWAEKARDAQKAGAVKAPAAKGTTHPTISADELVQMSLEEGWQGASTIPNVRKAMRKLMSWAKREQGIEYPASLKGEHLAEFARQLRRDQPKVAKPDLYNIRGLFKHAIAHKVLEGPNPCLDIPALPRQAKREKSLKRSRNEEKYISIEEMREIDQFMSKDKQFDLYLLQRFTGARQQEIAGIRCCDFGEQMGIKGVFIEAHAERGHGINGQKCGLKNLHSERFIPLPTVLHGLWKKYSSKSKKMAFPLQGKERNYGENYRSRLQDKCKQRGLPTGSHCFRKCITQDLTANGVRDYVVECICGRDLPIPDYLHEDIGLFAKAVEQYAELRPIDLELLSPKSPKSPQ